MQIFHMGTVKGSAATANICRFFFVKMAVTFGGWHSNLRFFI